MLIETAQKEKYYGLAQAEFEQLKDVLHTKKKKDLLLFQDKIRSLLENEIVSRYYYQRGRMQAALSRDESIDRAKETLSNPKAYSDILSPSRN